MPNSIYVFQCPNCDAMNDSGVLVCDSCGEPVRREWVEVITDGAPTGSSDPEYARGFRAGQAYGIKIITEQIQELITKGQS